MAGFLMANRRSLFDVTHGRGVETTVHVHDLTADAGRQIRAQEGAGVVDFFEGHVAVTRGLRFRVLFLALNELSLIER